MRIEYVSEFLTLAQTLNFSSAARQLRISQPTLSSHIKKLEEELGTCLFHRNHHQVQLTKEGALFVEYAEAMVFQRNSAMKAIAHMKESMSSMISIGYLYYAYRDCLPETVALFGNTYPDTNLRIRSLEYTPLSRALKNGDVDVALTIDVDEALHEDCLSYKLGEDPICCVVRRDDPLAQLPTISLTDLRQEALILPHPEYSDALARYYESFLHKAGVESDSSMLYGDIDTRTIDVIAGTGIALIGKHFERAALHDTLFIPVDEDYCKYDFVALWKRSNRNPTIGKFLEMLSRSFGKTVE